MHEDGQVKVDRLPPPLARLLGVPDGQVRRLFATLLKLIGAHMLVYRSGLMERVEWTDLGFQDGDGSAPPAPKAKEGHEPPPKPSKTV